MAENRLIVELVESFDKELFEKLINIRKTRLKLFPYEVNYEMAIEQIEGTANYIELEALKQLNYHKYVKKLKEMEKNILNPNNLMPIRIISYDIGALLVRILKDNGLKINYDFNDSYYLDFYLNKDINSDFDVIENNEIKDLIETYINNTQNIIERSVKKEN